MSDGLNPLKNVLGAVHSLLTITSDQFQKQKLDFYSIINNKNKFILTIMIRLIPKIIAKIYIILEFIFTVFRNYLKIFIE
jgi:hypothetical protein